MKTTNSYQHIATYEGKAGEVKRVLLLYSGGLDTSVMLKWIQDHYGAEVITLTAGIGQQQDDLPKIAQKALGLGAVKAFAIDMQGEFADAYLAAGIKANASYQGDYHISTPMGRAILAAKAVEIAALENADCIAHGATGKGNDQVRIEGYIHTLNSDLKIIAPVREWNMERDDEIAYALEHGISTPASRALPYSIDDNMWGISWEGGEIDDPTLEPKFERFLTVYTPPQQAPATGELVTLTFDNGLPTHLNGEAMTLSELIMKLNGLAGQHGIGIVCMTEDRLVGLKNRGVYQAPAAHTIITAHKALEQYVATRELNETKAMLDTKWAYLCYGAKWFDPAMTAINAYNDAVNEMVCGVVTLKLCQGTAMVVGLKSEFGIGHHSYVNCESHHFNVNASPGFTEIYTLQMKMAHAAKMKGQRLRAAGK